MSCIKPEPIKTAGLVYFGLVLQVVPSSPSPQEVGPVSSWLKLNLCCRTLNPKSFHQSIAWSSHPMCDPAITWRAKSQRCSLSPLPILSVPVCVGTWKESKHMNTMQHTGESRSTCTRLFHGSANPINDAGIGYRPPPPKKRDPLNSGFTTLLKSSTQIATPSFILMHTHVPTVLYTVTTVLHNLYYMNDLCAGRLSNVWSKRSQLVTDSLEYTARGKKIPGFKTTKEDSTSSSKKKNVQKAKERYTQVYYWLVPVIHGTFWLPAGQCSQGCNLSVFG